MLNKLKSKVSTRFEVSLVLEEYFKNNTEQTLDWILSEDFGAVEIVRKAKQRF